MIEREMKRYATHLDALRALGIEPNANGTTVTIDGKEIDVALIVDVGLERAMFGTRCSLAARLRRGYPDAVWTAYSDRGRLYGRGVIQACNVRLVVELPYGESIGWRTKARIVSIIRRFRSVIGTWYGMKKEGEQ